MHVLIPQTETPGAHIAAARLRGQGHTVSTCYEDSQSPWCKAVAGTGCPLDDAVDMVVVMRPKATSERLPREEAALCAASRGVPVVIGGAIGGHPYGAIATADDESSDITSVVRTVAALPLVRHSTAATAALRQSVAAHGVDPADAWAEVYRRDGGLKVRMYLPSDCPDSSLVGMAAVRVLGAMSDVDPWAQRVDVSANRLPGAA